MTLPAALHLLVTTPLDIICDDPAVASLRAEDGSGDFGILPGHADFLTVIDAGVMRWRARTGPWRYAALRGAVLRVTAGQEVRVAAREAILGEDLAALRLRVQAARAATLETQRTARSQGAGLQARAIRHLMRELAAGGDSLGLEDHA